MKSIRRWLAGLLVSMLWAAAAAQPFPNRPVRLIVPYPAVGSTDILALIAAKELGERLRQPFVIENKAGASGAIGSLEMAPPTPPGLPLPFGSPPSPPPPSPPP